MEKIRSTPQPQEHFSEHGSVVKKDGIFYAITYDGEQAVPIPESVAAFVSLSLRAQNKVLTGKYPRLAKLIATLNCRKTVFATASQMEVGEAIDRDHDDLDGVEQLFVEIQKLQHEGYEAVSISESFTEIEEYLDGYDGPFPCVVHTFEYDNAQLVDRDHLDLVDEQLLRQMHRVHSFLVLGEDENGYVCFQKMGPAPHQPFEIISAGKVFESYDVTEGRHGLAFVGPIL